MSMNDFLKNKTKFCLSPQLRDLPKLPIPVCPSTYPICPKTASVGHKANVPTQLQADQNMATTLTTRSAVYVYSKLKKCFPYGVIIKPPGVLSREEASPGKP